MRTQAQRKAAVIRALGAGLAGIIAATTLGACGSADPVNEEERLRVVATTGLLADIVGNVAGEDALVTALIPNGRDPHSFEPSLRTTRDVAHAEVQFANGLLLEPHNLLDTMREVGQSPVIEVADRASTVGAELIPLVENAALDAVWLGLRVTNATNSEPVDFALNRVEGPGEVSAYVMSTFGVPTPLFNSADGVDAQDATSLPANAHTHVSWGFSAPGIYSLYFQNHDTPVTIAVGVAPPPGRQVIDSGHIDIASDQATGAVRLEDGETVIDPAEAVIAVPSTTYQPIPADPAYRFLGVPGHETYLLPQAVLGKHIHGEVDPHLWHNVANVIAYVDVIAEELVKADPTNGDRYRERARAYQQRLRELDERVKRTIEGIPPERRQLVTTHHGYAYLEQGYGMKTAGFVTPNPAVEPSPRDVVTLQRTLENLRVPAVFLEPQAAPSAGTLTQTAAQLGVEVCTIYGDTLDERAPTYVRFMEHNARELARCLNLTT